MSTRIIEKAPTNDQPDSMFAVIKQNSLSFVFGDFFFIVGVSGKDCSGDWGRAHWLGMIKGELRMDEMNVGGWIWGKVGVDIGLCGFWCWNDERL